MTLPTPGEAGNSGSARAGAFESLRQRAESRVDAIVRSHPEIDTAHDLKRLVHELGAHQADLQLQNEAIHRAQADLEASRERYFDLYEHAPVGYVTFGMDGVILESNRMAASLLGMEREGLINRRLLEFIRSEQRPAFSDRYRKLAAGGSAPALELELFRADGSTFWAQLHMSLVHDQPGGAPSCRAAMVDISNRVEVQHRAATLAAIVEFSDDAIISRDINGRIVTWNAGATRLLGYSAEEMIGGTLDPLLPPERSDEPRWLHRLRRGEGLAHFEAELKSRDGRAVPISLSLSPIRDEAGRISGTSVIARDISERIEAERNQERRLRQLDLLSRAGQMLILRQGEPWEGLGELFWQVCRAIGADMYLHYQLGSDPDTLELVSSEGFTEAQRARGAVLEVGETLSGKVARERAPVVIENLQESAVPEARGLQSLGVRCFAGFPLIAGRRLMGVAVFASTLSDCFQSGDLHVLRTVCDQVSATLERAHLFQELHASEQELKAADRRKDDFLATLAHELRNPLAPIHNAVGILRRIGGTTGQEKALFETMERQVNYMVRLVDDLLEISRVTRGKISLRSERVALGGIMRSALEVSRPFLEAGQHSLELSMPPSTLVVEGDPVRLAQVFANLLNNAAKFTERGGRIVFAGSREGDQAVVRVRDNGIGISPALLPHVFDMFTQGTSTGKTQTGLGIGLTLARTLVEMHGGSVEASSEGPGKGSEFIVRLPVVEEAADSVVSAGETGPVLKGDCRVLIADDNQDAANSLAYLLELIGAKVEVVYDGQAALAALETFDATVAILDIGMPGMDGYEVARHIREHPRHKDITLIALTGWGQAEDRLRTRRSGFDFHLVKPADLRELQRILQSQCN